MGRATCLSLVGDAAHFLVCQSLWPCLNTITLNLLSPHVPEIQMPGQIHKPCGKTNLPVTGRLDPCVCRAQAELSPARRCQPRGFASVFAGFSFHEIGMPWSSGMQSTSSQHPQAFSYHCRREAETECGMCHVSGEGLRRTWGSALSLSTVPL